ncbi:MAG TPA: enoyl-CoA hydratase/isomerase family protein [Gemmatimonadaceae bacterium]
MTSPPRVRASTAGPVRRITLARPEKRNALDEQAARELAEALDAAEADADTRVVVLDAEGRDFCAGADLAALEGMIDAGADAHRRDAEALGRVFRTIRAMAKPVVAAVRGRALAGGAGLATSCDIVLASDDARFGYPEVRVGFVPAMVMTMLRRLAGEKRAFELVATGRTIGAREALEIGLVSRVLPAERFEAEVEEIVGALAASPPGALRLTKRLFYELDEAGFDGGIELGVRTNVEARATDEFRDGVRRFVHRGTGKP